MYKYISLTWTLIISHPLSTRSSHEQKLHSVLPNCFKFSFFNRVVSAWNSLPNFVISAQNPVLFCEKIVVLVLQPRLLIHNVTIVITMFRFVAFVPFGCTHYCFFIFIPGMSLVPPAHTPFTLQKILS